MNIDDPTAHDLNDKFFSTFTPPDLPESYDDHRICPYFTPTTEEEVVSMIRQRKSNSIGADGIPGYFIRSFVDELAAPLKIIYNRCLQSGVFPDFWKCANILPHPKGKTDYRPISILPFLSKVLVRLIRDLILLHSMNHSLNLQQFGFIPGRNGGCTNAVIAIRLSILQHISKSSSHYARVLAVDFRKAFDTVSHATLLKVLSDNFGCNTFVLKVIRDFLANRFQRVITSNVVTPWKPLTSGVPQGSILGPLLFVTLIDDLPQLRETKIIAYADDMTLIYLNELKCSDCFQSDVDVFTKWVSDRKLVVNVDKTKCMTISRTNCNPTVSPIYINNACIEEVENLKILGVFFSFDAKWDKQFSELYNRCCRAMSIVKRLKCNSNRGSVVWQAYTSLVYCHMSFCWPAICDVSKTNLKKLVQLDRVAQRWAKVNDIPSLQSRLDKTCIRIIKKISCAKENHPLSEFFCIEKKPKWCETFTDFTTFE